MAGFFSAGKGAAIRVGRVRQSLPGLSPVLNQRPGELRLLLAPESLSQPSLGTGVWGLARNKALAQEAGVSQAVIYLCPGVQCTQCCGVKPRAGG